MFPSTTDILPVSTPSFPSVFHTHLHDIMFTALPNKTGIASLPLSKIRVSFTDASDLINVILSRVPSYDDKPSL